MWVSLLICLVFTVAVLYLPGFALGKILSIRWVDAVCFAPPVSIALFSIIEICLSFTGTVSSVPLIAAISSVIILFAFAVARFAKSRKVVWPARQANELAAQSKADYALLLYLLVGSLAVLVFYLKQLDGADSFFEGWDNTSHLTSIRAFAESGIWNPLFADKYVPGETTPYISSQSGFYPSALYILCAASVSLFSVSPMVALNAVNAVMVAVVFPLGFYYLLRRLSGDNVRILIIGSLLCLGTAVSPWDLLTYGPLFPNLFSMSFVPAAMGAFVDLCRQITSSQNRRTLTAFVLLVCSVIAVFFGHPNGVFALIVLLAPILVQTVSAEMRKIGVSFFHRILAAGTLIALMVCFWILCFNLPLFKGVVSVNWPAIDDVPSAAIDVLCFSMVGRPASYVAALLLCIGIISLLKSPHCRWLVISFFLAGCLYVLSAGTDGFLKQFATGFWYTDYHRLAVVAAYAGSLVASFGGGDLLDRLLSRVDKIGSDDQRGMTAHRRGGVVAQAVLYGVVGLALYAGAISFGDGYKVTTPFGYQASETAAQYNKELVYYDVLTNEELEFTRSAASYIEKDAKIVNNPDDGSLFLYATDGLRMYYRSGLVPDKESETPESKLIRTRLYDISNSQEVRNAVKKTGVKYVLQLDYGERSDELRINYSIYNPEDWKGIELIDENTPGFTLVLKNGDMRLYRIDG